MAKREPIGIKLDANSMTAFKQALRYEFENLKTTKTEVLKWAAVYFTKSARKETKQARKNSKRKLVRLDTIPNGRKRRDAKSKYWGVIVLSQNARARTHLLHGSEGMSQAEAKKMDFVKVPNVGASKNSWYGALRDVKAGVSGAGLRKKTSGVAFTRQKFNETATIWNRLLYILKINPNLESHALGKAAKGIALRVERRIGKKW